MFRFLDRHRRLLLVPAVAALIITIDQISKSWAMSSLMEGHDRPLIDHLLSFRLRFNTGGTLGALQGQTLLWIVVQAAMLIVIPAIPFLVRADLGTGAWVGIALLVGAAASNLIDQLRLAAAVDLVHVPYLTFNLADVAGVSGAIAVIRAIPPDAKLSWFWSQHREFDLGHRQK